ncbi:MAG: tetratricopeptide repeat protein, partial [Pseudomonadota bacterium]
TINGLTWALTSSHAGNWHPLTWLSHMLDCDLYGLDPKGHHLNNLLFHIANTVILFLVLSRITGARYRSAFVAGLFALHPLHVESVAWVAERKDVLSTFFGLLAIWAYIRYADQPGAMRYLGAFIFYILSLASKPMLITLPFLLLLLDYWPLRRFEFKNPSHSNRTPPVEPIQPTSRNGPMLPLILEKAPFLLLAMASGIVTLWAQQNWGAIKTLTAFPLKARLANAFITYATYIGKMIWPQNLAVFYPHTGEIWPLWQAIGSALFLAITSLLVIRSARIYAYLLVGWFWYLGTLLPVIGIVQVGLQKMADRYTYVPLIGLFVIIVWGVHDLVKGWRHRTIVLTLSTIFIFSSIMVITWRQIGYWKDSVSLFEHTLEVTSYNYVAHYNLGVYHTRQGNLKKAVHHYGEALKINPNFAEAYHSLGVSLTQQGHIKEAIPYYQKALRIMPDLERAHNDLGVALAMDGKIKEAISHFTEALRLKPGYREAKNNLEIAVQEIHNSKDE